ncbi:hypothetical protein HK096_002531, partial [Nowakowskiella sp. JEL0078]
MEALPKSEKPEKTDRHQRESVKRGDIQSGVTRIECELRSVRENASWATKCKIRTEIAVLFVLLQITASTFTATVCNAVFGLQTSGSGGVFHAK